MAQATLLDIAKLNGADKVVGLIEENASYAPEFNVVPARTIRGTTYPVVIRTAFPSVAFRSANPSSVTATASTYINKLVQCFILGGAVIADKAVAAAYEDGVEAWQTIEASGVMKAAMLYVGKQFYYGNQTTYAQGDASGFPGLVQMVDSTLTYDAGGTTASTGSSIYGIKKGEQGVQFVLGQSGDMSLRPFSEQLVSGVDSWVSALTAWIGLQGVAKNSMVRIKKVTADSGKTCTDAVLNEAFALLPVGWKPDLWLMSRRSAKQLQNSRTVVIQSNGAGTPGLPTGSNAIIPPFPTNCNNGIPIQVTDSILDTEPLTL